MPSKKWSVIIPALNEELNIARCLASIASLDYDLTSVEVVVVDNGSADQTVDVARSFSARLDIVVHVVESVSVSELRNTGARRAAASRFCFLDADCAVLPGWLGVADEIVERHPDAIVGAYYSLPEIAGWPARVWQRRFHQGRSGAVPYIPGGNLLMSRQVFETVGGFDPALRSNEDSEFCSRARALNVAVLVFPPLSTIHFGAERDLRHFVARQWWHGSNVISRSGIRTNRRAVGIAAYTLGCWVAMMVAALTGSRVLLEIALAAVICPPLWVVLRGRQNKADSIGLFVLVLVYGTVRALVLPIAMRRFLAGPVPTSPNRRPAGEKCT